ncbi:MAG TPA: tRNA (adenosine(37)-N6)-threonylcarbamoyltransferase complex dimerization subunit type 1 TsaB [Gaiellaceae bacterium]
MSSLEEATRGFVLALEGATAVASCAVSDPAGSILELVAEPGVKHVEGLPQLAADAAARAGVALRDVGCIVVGSGPGSYMGIRATVAVANALSYAAGCPVAEISTLDSLGIELASAEHESVVALVAGRGRYFTSSYRLLDGTAERLREPELLEGEDAARLAGPGIAVYGLEAERRPTAAGHLRAIDLRPGWLRLEGIAGAQPRYGPSGREA